MNAVHFEYLTPVKLYIPGPLASRAGDALRDMQQTIATALQGMRHSAESNHDPAALEVLAERLHEVTKKVRRAERAHVIAWTAEVQARQLADAIGTDTETPGNEPAPEPEP